jgi:hypothetical protein
MSIQDHEKNERLEQTKWILDPRRGFIERFLRYKYSTGSKLPIAWDEAIDWLSEFDAMRSEANIVLEKMFYEHMSTCLHPIFIPKELWPKESEKDESKKST